MSTKDPVDPDKYMNEVTRSRFDAGLNAVGKELYRHGQSGKSIIIFKDETGSVARATVDRKEVTLDELSKILPEEALEGLSECRAGWRAVFDDYLGKNAGAWPVLAQLYVFSGPQHAEFMLSVGDPLKVLAESVLTLFEVHKATSVHIVEHPHGSEDGSESTFDMVILKDGQDNSSQPPTRLDIPHGVVCAQVASSVADGTKQVEWEVNPSTKVVFVSPSEEEGRVFQSLGTPQGSTLVIRADIVRSSIESGGGSAQS